LAQIKIVKHARAPQVISVGTGDHSFLQQQIEFNQMYSNIIWLMIQQ